MENNTQGPGKQFSPLWLLLDRKSTVNVIMKKELVKDILDASGRFVHVHCNTGGRIIRIEATLPGYQTIWFDDRRIKNICYLFKEKEKHRTMYDSAKGNQFIIFIPDKEVLFNKIRNGLYSHDIEDRDLALVNKVEVN